MCSNSSCYQLQADYYIHKMLYMNLYYNHKSKILIHKRKWERNLNITLKKVIKLNGKREREELKKKTERNCYRKTENNRMAVSIHLLIITLDVNGLSYPTKKRRVAWWVKKQDPSIRGLQKTHFRETDRLKVKKWRKIFQTNWTEKTTSVAILISD